MSIVSHKDYCFGKPRVDGTRLWVSLIVENVESDGVDETLAAYQSLTPDKVRECLDYCRRQQCQGKVVKYCQGCTKDHRVIKDDPAGGIHVLGDVSLTQALMEWDPANKVLSLGSEEDLNRKRDLWIVAEELYQENYGEVS